LSAILQSRYNRIKYSFKLLCVLFVFQISQRCDYQPADSPSAGFENSISYELLSEQLIHAANGIAGKEPVVVSGWQTDGFTAGERAYVSLACYWWPNPDSEDGLPYIRKDGEVNPETRTSKSDLPALIEMAGRVELLSAAYGVSGYEDFAVSAIKQLDAWFVNEETAMLPHLQYGQMVKGRNTGRSYGIIDTWWLVRVVRAFEILEYSSAWTEELEAGLKAWFTHYLNWLRNSGFGQSEMRTSNNHGTWYDVQIVTFAKFTRQEYFAKEYLENITLKRLNRQIAFTGRQKHEIRRSRPAHYSIFNLSGWMELAGYGEELGVDIINRTSVMNPGLQGALRRLVRMISQTGLEQVHNPVDQTDSDRLYLDILIRARNLYNDSIYADEMMRVFEEVRKPELVLLRPGLPSSFH
jgi:hypothetical protein